MEDASPEEILLVRDDDNSDKELNRDDVDIYQTFFFHVFSVVLSFSYNLDD